MSVFVLFCFVCLFVCLFGPWPKFILVQDFLAFKEEHHNLFPRTLIWIHNFGFPAAKQSHKIHFFFWLQALVHTLQPDSWNGCSLWCHKGNDMGAGNDGKLRVLAE